jgi:hypothetical protein
MYLETKPEVDSLLEETNSSIFKFNTNAKMKKKVHKM